MKFRIALLAAAIGMSLASPKAQAGIQYVFGIDNLVGKTSTDGTLNGMVVRIGKFSSGFTPTRLNYDDWSANFVSMLPGTETLVSDATSFLTAAAPDTGPWRMSNNSITINEGDDPVGFDPGDQIYIWLSNSTIGSATTQVALLTEPSWTYVTATNEPQPNVTFALQDQEPTLVVGNTFSDHFQESSTEVGIRLVTRNITVPSPELVVESPAGSPLVDNVSTAAFGTVANNTFVTRDFFINNVGNADLTGVSANITGDASFSISLAPATPVTGPTGNTTVTVKFQPPSSGTKNAVLHIVSNDAVSPSFEINLTGSGTPVPGTMAINLPPSSIITVNEESGPVLIPLLRTAGSDGTIVFTVTTTNGTATVNTDYTAPANLDSMGDGVVTQNISIPILNPMNTSEGNETFTVSIGGGALTSGGTTSVTVRIIDSADPTAPVAPVVTTPAAALVGVNTGATINVTGTATDNKGVRSVKVKLNNGAFEDAALTAPDTASTNWSLTVTPVTGPNTVTVQSFDTRNNPSTLTARTFTVTRPLTVTVNSTLGSVTTGFTPSPTFREVGKTLTITATPKPSTTTPAFAGAIFTGWTLGGQDVASSNAAFTPQRLGMAASALEKQTITFIFREGLTLTPNFTANPFAPLAGTYNGLIRPSATLPDRSGAQPDGTIRDNGTEGFFTGTLMNTGAFSGKLTIDGFVLNVAGSFDQNGDARFGTARTLTQTVPRTGKPSLIVALHLNTAENQTNAAVDDKISGTVTATEFKQSVTSAVSLVDSDRAFYNGTTVLVPAAYLGAANANGIFTTVLPAKDVVDQPPGLSATDYPRGDGVATITITKGGVVTVTGTLAEGTAFTASSTLSEIGATHASRFALFSSLYTAKGFLSGFVQLDSTQPGSDLAATNLQWLRPFIGTSHYYPYGWPEVIKVDLLAAKYAALAGQSVLKAANSANIQAADADGNATLSFGEGQLTESLVKSANLSLADVVTKVPDNDPTFALTVNRITGAVTGTFTHTDDTVPAFNAIIYQKGPNAGAYGYFLTKQPVPISFTGESGSVSLIGQP